MSTNLYQHDPQLAVHFTPGDVRTHFDGHEDEGNLLAELPDAYLAEAGREVVGKDAGLYEATCQTFNVILDRAIEIANARRN